MDWWNDAGLFLQLGLSVAASDTAPVAFDVKLIDGRGGDFGSNSEGFVFGLIGPELRFLPASPVSPFVAAHVGIGFDMDGGMTAATGEAGVRLRTST